MNTDCCRNQQLIVISIMKRIIRSRDVLPLRNKYSQREKCSLWPFTLRFNFPFYRRNSTRKHASNCLLIVSLSMCVFAHKSADLVRIHHVAAGDWFFGTHCFVILQNNLSVKIFFDLLSKWLQRELQLSLVIGLQTELQCGVSVVMHFC